ncbi:MerR family transcriptional regulator [Paenibacillus oryzisoli]|uniref:MerR family transcriptional regulator n=1 Tax=Paenibacillus oryzisoli TaxID=1850517 RepID=UPI003D2781E2
MKTYTINEVAQKFDLTAHTLRYYDKEGLLPFVTRTPAGKRIFSDHDLEWMKLICCLKDTGMPIKDIKQYSNWVRQGSESIETRKAMLAAHREEVLKQIEALHKNVDIIDAKIAFYENPELRTHQHPSVAMEEV